MTDIAAVLIAVQRIVIRYFRRIEFRKTLLDEFVPLMLIIGTIVVAGWFIFYFPQTRYASWHLTSTGQIGDTIGGLSGPFIGILNAVLLWWTLRVQNSQIERQNFRSGIDKRIDSIERIIERCSLTVNEFNPNRTRVKYTGLEAIYRANRYTRDGLAELNRREIEEIEWQIFIDNVQSIYREMARAVSFFEFLDQPSGFKRLGLRDLASQTSEIRNFASSYIDFVEWCEANGQQNSFRDDVKYLYLRARRNSFNVYISTNT